LFLLVTVVFGTAFSAVKAGLSFIPPLLFAAARSYLSAVLLLAYVGVTAEYWHPRTRRDWVAVFAGGLFLIGGTGLGFVGIAVVIRPDPTSLLDPEIVGKLLFFAGVSVVSLGTVLVRQSEATMPVPTLTGWAMVVGGPSTSSSRWQSVNRSPASGQRRSRRRSSSTSASSSGRSGSSSSSCCWARWAP
jgi:drug/metabolite transporter (DMT)-like permease